MASAGAASKRNFLSFKLLLCFSRAGVFFVALGFYADHLDKHSPSRTQSSSKKDKDNHLFENSQITSQLVPTNIPMHPQIKQNKPGNCPICGMALEPLQPTLDEGEDSELKVISMSERIQKIVHALNLYASKGEQDPLQLVRFDAIIDEVSILF